MKVFPEFQLSFGPKKLSETFYYYPPFYFSKLKKILPNFRQKLLSRKCKDTKTETSKKEKKKLKKKDEKKAEKKAEKKKTKKSKKGFIMNCTKSSQALYHFLPC